MSVAATATATPAADPTPSSALNKRKRKREKEKANKKAGLDVKTENEEKGEGEDVPVAAVKKMKLGEGKEGADEGTAKAKAETTGKPSTGATAGTETTDAQKKKRRRGGKQISKRKAKAAAAAAAEGDGEESKKSTVKGKGEPKKPLVEGLNKDMSMMDPKLLADYYVQKLKWFEKDMSSIELEDRRISESSFLDTTSFTEDRYLAELPKFLETFHKSTPLSDIPLTSSSPTPGTPHTLILTSSAIRATHVIRALRTLQTSKDIIIAKLFAKHIKLSESITLCNSTRISIGVGTPSRMLELMRESALKIDGCVRLVLDLSAVNEKRQGLLDVKDTQKGVVEFVNEESVKKRLDEGSMKVLVF